MTTRPIEHLNVALSAGVVATAALFAGPHFALSVAAGAILEGINFRGLSAASKAFFAGAVRGSAAWLVLLTMRLALVAAVLFVALSVGADPLGLLIGISVILPASVAGAWRMRPASDPDAPVLADHGDGIEPKDWGWDASLYAEAPPTNDRDRDDSELV